LVAREVFEVLYSPVKAFKKIIEKPDFKGVLLILVLVMFSVVISQYVVASKFFIRAETPDDDEWTESVSLWNSSGSLLLDGADYKVGNYSVESFVSNDTSIWMKITGVGPFDCSGDTGYKELFFWIKWINQNGTFPTNATLRLFSESENKYFELDLTAFISTSSNEWSNSTVNNATLEVGPKNLEWNRVNSPDWKSVTGLEFKLVWLVPANLTMKIDDLHFRKYVPFLETGAFSGIIISTLISVAVVFFINWILWAGILLLTIKVFHEKGDPWTKFFIIIGHVFIVTVIYELASVALFSTLSPLNLPVKALPAATEEEANAVNALIEKKWYPNWAYWGYGLLSGFYFPFVREIWIVALCAIAIFLLCKITWRRAASISLTAFLLRTILRLFIGL
jgi:hypothetical protein